ncbi:SprT-like domain-containing protein, partial [Pediococcus pentosaceus]
MTDLELTQLTRRLAKQFFNQTYPYEARFNRRLRTTGGRYFLRDHHIEINPLMLSEFDEETLVGVIKHELIHYW